MSEQMFAGSLQAEVVAHAVHPSGLSDEQVAALVAEKEEQ